VWLKFFASYVVVIMLAMLVWGAASSVFIEKHLLQSTEEQLLQSGEEINRILVNLGPDQITVSLLRLLSGQFEGELYLTDIEGMVVASSLGRKNLGLMVADEVMRDIRAGKNVTQAWENPDAEERVIAVATPIMTGDEVSGAILLVAPVKGVEAATKAVQSQVIRASLLALILGALVSLGVAYSMTRQIREISQGTSRFAREDLGYRIPVITSDELGEVAQSFNEMAEQIASNTARRQSLLAGVSHEVRTPLTNIRGYVEALRDGVIPLEDRDKTLDLIHHEALFMEKMVSDLIDLTRMDTEKYRLNIERVNLGDLIDRTVLKFQQLAASKNNRIEVRCPENLCLNADEVRLEQLLTNLIKNALQFTDEGVVEILAEAKGDQVELAVRDNGIGITRDQLPYIFDSFYKGDPSRAKVHTESGLGLAIVQSIVKLHHGSIQVVSEPGEGTAVIVLLPKNGPKDL